MDKYIEQLLNYGLAHKMIEPLDIPVARNQMMDLLKVEEPFDGELTNLEYEALDGPSKILYPLLDLAVEAGLIENTVTARDILDAKLMACMMPRQSELNTKFQYIYKDDPVAATDMFYKLSIASNYIHKDRIDKNMYWTTDTPYGPLEITINLSKPEKDPKEIAAAKLAPQSNYPKCFLCFENTGYVGRSNHPARSNHRVVPVTLNEEQWYFQYSPYVYYNEHAIVFKEAHEPMKISKASFLRVLDFVEQFPHYFIGSNADLPIVGGSILSHDHFQGGYHTFPMAEAENIYTTNIDGFEDISVSIVKWPMSVVRLQGKDKRQLAILADVVLKSWKAYSDEGLGIYAFSDDIPHNTITPICRMRGQEIFELDLVLRNNRQTKEHPDGLFHPHAHLHHIKKENIGLIEVMGLAVLPARLKANISQITSILCFGETFTWDKDIASVMKGDSVTSISMHKNWIEAMIDKYGTMNDEAQAKKIVMDEIGFKFLQVLECAGVFKQDDLGISGMKAFINQVNK